jgi:hypothetical protein
VADVARALGEDQKALYRKRDALLKQLRADLEGEGVRDADAHELLATLDWHAALTGAPADPWIADPSRPHAARARQGGER